MMISDIIKIISPDLCVSCRNKTCTNSCNVVERPNFYNLKAERNTCPNRFLDNGPTDKQLNQGYIDLKRKGKNEGESTKEGKCIHCFLCGKQCSQENISISEEAINNPDNLDIESDSVNFIVENIANTTVMSYLNIIFDFGANTNLNKSLNFDGYVCMKNGEGAFVETDYYDDSLESCRRILADIMLYNYRNEKEEIKDGIIVLRNFPKEGSQNIYTLIEAIHSFSATADLNIFITTVSFLRYLIFHIQKNQYSYEELFFNIAEEKYDDYKNRLIQTNILNDTEASSLLK